MQPRRPRFAGALAATLVMVASVAGLGAAAGAATAAQAAGCQSLTGAQPLNPDMDNQLTSVAVLSPCNVWAAGSYVSGGLSRTLIEHWNGASWRVVPSPSPGTGENFLLGVRGRSASDIWAVGFYSSAPSTTKTLILHWNGHTWQQVPSPNQGAEDTLSAVRTVSATDAWAVGSTFDGNTSASLILHWNGHTWKHVPSPSAGTGSDLSGVTATSASNAWAVGNSDTSTDRHRTLILHWNGRTWSKVASPSPGVEGILTAVGASSASSAWAVGDFDSKSGARDGTLTLHWNGHTWSKVSSPNAGGSAVTNFLQGVTVISGSNAWAAGLSGNTPDMDKPLILHWNGHTWQQTAAPNAGASHLLAVAASSASNVWAVGITGNGAASQTFAIHCC